MQKIISKSQFIAKISEYLRGVEKQNHSLVITHNKKPVVKIIPVSLEGLS